ncbi:glycoside hydrolase family 18 protein [Dendrothele bispora CBS 962.96]|uniref:Glycoside hydrolase family 18 protein n=1 Tax=Dendrothele bispora (strain CBS 962.96) TaxID=1314807 RepID=A0A4S8M5Q7_DENBC|nr:glycoside hydrolase family 18 protein [Dendrothele bispora CBS 962.96]
MSGPQVIIDKHTTSSFPRPHIRYIVQVTYKAKDIVVEKRYSEFLALQSALQFIDPDAPFPPKRILTTSFFPSAWADDVLIAERKAGLAEYLEKLLMRPGFEGNQVLKDFLTPNGTRSTPSECDKFDLEDAVPSTLSRKAALDVLKASKEVRDQDISPIAAAYYPDWSAGKFPPESLDYSKFDIIFFAFATPSSSSGLDWDSGSQDILGRLVGSARASGQGTRIVLSVGGWGGSTNFSNAVSNDANRRTFTNALSSAVNDFGLDGIDIDWEYPNSPGAGHPYSPSDAGHFYALLKLLRQALGPSKIISAAVAHLPWLGSSGLPLTDVAKYTAEMTYINIMNYDVWGASANPGPNAPLGDLCGTSSQPTASARAALKQWTDAGCPANKLLLGLPLYGYVSNSTRTTLTGNFVDPTSEDSDDDKGRKPLGGAHARNHVEGTGERNEDGTVKSTRANADLRGWYGQQIPFSEIVRSGALVKNSDGNYVQSGGFTYAWDNCSDTPFLYNVSQSTVVTFDDTYSLKDKATFARENGMAGCFTWSLDQDDGLTLQDAIRLALGK